MTVADTAVGARAGAHAGASSGGKTTRTTHLGQRPSRASERNSAPHWAHRRLAGIGCIGIFAGSRFSVDTVWPGPRAFSSVSGKSRRALLKNIPRRLREPCATTFGPSPDQARGIREPSAIESSEQMTHFLVHFAGIGDGLGDLGADS